jgi:hypothetical protein
LKRREKILDKSPDFALKSEEIKRTFFVGKKIVKRSSRSGYPCRERLAGVKPQVRKIELALESRN